MENTFGYLLDIGFVAFATIFLIPLLVISYPVVKWWRKCWVRFVKWKHPECTLVSENCIRTVLDYGKYQGIYTLLIQGTSIAEGTRSHLAHFVSTKPFLRMALRTKWGLYAWERLSDFSVDNHLVHSPTSFKGRPITENNVQDYVSDVTSKFLPPNHSPWQVHIVTCFLHGKESKFCLVRVHHLLLRQEHVALADFLPLKFSQESWACRESDSPFINLYAEPSALPQLHQKLTESFSNIWNEFLCNNDPTERPEILKKQIGIFQCAKIGVIVCFSAIKELTRQCRKSEGLRSKEVLTVLWREAARRNFTATLVFQSLLDSLNPIHIIKSIISWIWYLAITLTLKTPILFLRELRALKSSQKHYYPDTLTSMLFNYVPLIFQAVLEIFTIAGITLGAPKAILDELFFKHTQSNQLQRISPCGRKVVAWSEEIDVKLLEKISALTGASEPEILLAATVDSLKNYFRLSGLPIPENVLATIKFVSQKSLFVQNNETKGLLCLALPTRTPLFEDDLVEILQMIQKNVQDARSRQRSIYAITAAESSRGLLTACLPSLFLKIILYYLTRRYSISLTHVDGDLPVEGVKSALFWKPPQGNSSLSMTLHRHGNEVRLAVMGDAMLGPQHSIITNSFPRSIHNLAKTVGVSQTPNRSPSPSPASPTTSPGY